MKVKVMNSIKKVAAVATGALFLGATMGAAAVFGSGLSGLGSGSLNFIHSGAVNSVVVVSANANPEDILGSIDIASALTAAAAATHSGSGAYVTIGTLALSATSRTSQIATANGTAFSAWNPVSANLNKVNFSYGGNTVANKNNNYTAIENVTFSAANKAYLNGLNVVLPVGSFQLASYVINRSNTNAVVPVASADGLEYLFGSAQYTLINSTATNYTVGVEQTLTNVKMPSTVTVGTHTVGLQGLATVTGANGQYYQLEFNVDGGSTNYVNFSKTTTVSGVTLTTGLTSVSNVTGEFLSSLKVSSISLVQNFSSANVFNLGNYNSTASSLDFLNFSNTAKVPLTYSFTAASSFALPLSTLSLEPLTHTYSSSENLTVATGKAGNITLVPVKEAANTAVVLTNKTETLSGVNFGVDFRGPLTSSGTSGPDFVLQPYQSLSNLTGTFNASSEYLLPFNNSATYSEATWTTPSFSFAENAATGVNEAPLLFQLPNGKSFAIQFTMSGVSGSYYANATTLWNGSYTTPITINASKSYDFGGFNLSFVENAAANSSLKVVLSGPIATVKSVVGAASSVSYSFVPGFSKLYADNGTGYTSAPVGANSYFGSLSFNGNTLTYTDPVGGTQSVSIAENKTNYYTNVSSPTNTSATTWGAFVSGASVKGATFVVPAQNYTLALGGSQAISSRQNYSVGQSTTGSGEVLNIGGSSAMTASSLFGSGVFPLAELDSSFTAATNNVPVVVVGGPAVNTVAQALLGQSGPVYGNQFTNLTGVGSGQALVQLFSASSAVNGQNAILVAGWESADTLAASEVVSEYLLGTPVLNLNGNKMILSTGTAGYTGETIVSTS